MVWIGLVVWLVIAFGVCLLVGRVIAFGNQAQGNPGWSAMDDLGPDAHDQTIVR